MRPGIDHRETRMVNPGPRHLLMLTWTLPDVKHTEIRKF
jgi:hypothetical protein